MEVVVSREDARPVVTVVYGSTFGDTADIAGLVARELADRLGAPVPVHDVASVRLATLTASDVLVVGCSTWHAGELQADWGSALGDVLGLDWTGTHVALFGPGDAGGYPDTYVDALGILAEAFEAGGATLVGAWPTVGYAHARSRAVRGGRFVGLALDVDSEPEATEPRVQRWCAGLVAELGLPPAGVTSSAPTRPAPVGRGD
jgi:flavodoxin I